MEVDIKDTIFYKGKVWYKKGDPLYFHREDGPALIYDNGIEEWHYHDVKYKEPKDMPLNLFLAYVKWEYKKKNGNN